MKISAVEFQKQCPAAFWSVAGPAQERVVGPFRNTRTSGTIPKPSGWLIIQEVPGTPSDNRRVVGFTPHQVARVERWLDDGGIEKATNPEGSGPVGSMDVFTHIKRAKSLNLGYKTYCQKVSPTSATSMLTDMKIGQQGLEEMQALLAITPG